MKNFLFLTILCVLFLKIQAQEIDSVAQPTFYEFGHPEIFPRFPGGEKNLYSFLKNNLIYPEHEKELKIEGTVLVRFEVDEFGKIGLVEILKSEIPNFSIEALRLINLSLIGSLEV